MARRARAITLTVLALLAACERAQTPPAAAARPAVRPAPVRATDVRAYELGRRREILVTVAALGLLRCAATSDQYAVVEAATEPDRIAADGARAAGLAAGQYAQLVARVDSLLIERLGVGSATEVDGGTAQPSLAADVAGLLDSLRVALVVARERLEAEAAQPFHGSGAAHKGAC